MTSSMGQVTQIEKQVRRVERDLTKIRFELQKLKSGKRAPKLDTLQRSIASHLLSDEDPVRVLEQMRRRNRQ